MKYKSTKYNNRFSFSISHTPASSPETPWAVKELRVLCQKLIESFSPTALRSNLVHQVLEDREDGKNPVIAYGNWLMPFSVLVFFRDHGLVTQLPVPQSAVVGADISHHVQGAKPGFKELVSLFLEGQRRFVVSHDALRSEKEKPARIEHAKQRLGGCANFILRLIQVDVKHKFIYRLAPNIINSV